MLSGGVKSRAIFGKSSWLLVVINTDATLRFAFGSIKSGVLRVNKKTANGNEI
jgi:hypothetical protein